ncbi:MAG: S-layer homology domain-containing protein [Bacillota bacterium]
MGFRLPLIWVTLALIIGLWPVGASASVLHLEGGIANEQEYREVLWVTGRPILLTGKVKETVTAGKDGSVTYRLTYTNLGNQEHKIAVTRSLTFVASQEQKDNQRISVTRLTSFRETISVDKDRYVLEDYQFAHSAITDQQPVVGYHSANWTARKTYNVNKNAGKAVVETWGSSVGYQHNWGKTVTHRIDGTVNFDGKVTVDKNQHNTNWAGSFQVNLSNSHTRRLAYQPNEPSQISFAGGYLEVRQDTGTLQYNCNLPNLEKGLVKDSRRLQEAGSRQLASLPRQQRLPVPLLRDIQGHWALEDILSLASLEAFPGGGEYFGPRLPMLRGDFAKALVVITGLSLPVPPPAPKGTTRTVPQPEQPVFADVTADDPFYYHYKAVFQAGLMQGTGPGLFSPQQSLTRAQAITIMVRALGLENTAPVTQGKTSFRDDAAIPVWARDAVFVAHRLGLVKGDDYGYVLPNQVMTRAEAAAFLNRFIRYLQTEMKAEYRERILNYR